MNYIREIVLDTETTGLRYSDGHKIIEIGAVEMINKEVTENYFHCYINPKREVPKESYKIHGISYEFLADKPIFKDIVNDFLGFIKNDTLVIHNADFDIGFLNYELNLLKMPPLACKVEDTLKIARKRYPGKRVNLDALCKKFQIDNSHRQLHGALKDALLLTKVYIELLGGRQYKLNINSKISHQSSINDKQLILEKKIKLNNYPIILPNSEELTQFEAFSKKFIKSF
ncbi:DNA polymerase III subunit epsilon [Rickettsia endosymbiont of Cardiosporidium cionae]|uniref:DNA polymerase III subunit epsilon n=1 Tax=Rickettsia endosymbiont of Cardiosporidium cionae TaxID=2777155 RepID=UPI001895C699|nr:DNA polymerase III subunit epsilon [Rickettsia endosymbiont of Cardiosporidium cionae]KAF8818848.1 DNA polymerase III subunit epsilon [Rickettsia endosymbiont of Cardiosporidium cionae]